MVCVRARSDAMENGKCRQAAWLCTVAVGRKRSGRAVERERGCVYNYKCDVA